MFKILYDPVSVIKEDIKDPSFPRTMLVLFAASLFETIGLLFLAWRFVPDVLNPNTVALGIFAVLGVIIASHLIAAFFFALAMHVLDGKGGYYEGLATLVLSLIAPAITIFFAGALSFIPFGTYLGLLLLAYGYILGTATLFRSAKEMFKLDYAGVLVGFLITVVVLSIIVCYSLNPQILVPY